MTEKAGKPAQSKQLAIVTSLKRIGRDGEEKKVIEMDIQAIKNEILEASKTFEADPKKITLLRSMSVREAQDYLFGEGDFAQDICCAHGIEITDYPDLRDCQHDLIYAHASE